MWFNYMLVLVVGTWKFMPLFLPVTCLMQSVYMLINSISGYLCPHIVYFSLLLLSSQSSFNITMKKWKFQG